VYLAVLVALAATPAAAQVGGKRNREEPKKTDAAPKIDDKAYKAALERIPEPKEKYDPWGGVAPAAPAKKGK